MKTLYMFEATKEQVPSTHICQSLSLDVNLNSIIGVFSPSKITFHENLNSNIFYLVPGVTFPYFLNVQSSPFGACLQDFAARRCVAQSPGDSFELHIMSQYNMSWPYSMGMPRQIHHGEKVRNMRSKGTLR